MTQGQEDVIGAKGALRKDQGELIVQEGFSFSGYERDGLYHAQGNGKFVDISGVSGIDSLSDGRAAVFADFDDDGDLDVFLTTIQGQSHLLFRNEVGQEARHLRVTLEGVASGRDAFGAVVRAKTSAGIVTRLKAGGSGYLSQHDPRLLLGLGEDRKAAWLEVTWPSGKVERFTDVAAGSVRLREGKGALERLVEKPARLPDPPTPGEALLQGLKLAVGRPLPALPVTTDAGKAGTFAALAPRGKKVLLNLWATWCVPCAREMPELARLAPKLAARGIVVMGLSVDEDPGAVKPFLAKLGITYPVLVAGPGAREAIYAGDEIRVPLSLLIDEQGRVSDVIPGWSRASRRKIEDLAAPQGRPKNR